MSRQLFKQGGPHHIRRTGRDKYEMRVTIPTDSEGRTARACPNENCSPGYFRVLGGTGIVDGQETAFCPYCRQEEEPNAFFTEEQVRYATDIAEKEALAGMEGMLKDALGLDGRGKRKFGGGLVSTEMTMKSSPKRAVRRPFEEEVRRDVVCPHCGLDQSVYGLAVWCADCGADIFLTHVEAEIAVLRGMLLDVPRRRESLGRRVAAKDLENCLEDAVSIFEAVLRAMVHRKQRESGVPVEEAERQNKRIGNGFQNVRRAADIATKELSITLYQDLGDADVGFLARTFEKRHPITHNLGVVDRKYIERVQTAEREGREVLVLAGEIEKALDLTMRTFHCAHRQLFTASGEPLSEQTQTTQSNDHQP